MLLAELLVLMSLVQQDPYLLPLLLSQVQPHLFQHRKYPLLYQLSVDSHAKAVAAKKNGWTKDEITPYQTKVTDKDGNESVVTVD